ncbi:MAG: hypothetical protein V4638_12325 [Bacteroidota bacterium]
MNKTLLFASIIFTTFVSFNSLSQMTVAPEKKSIDLTANQSNSLKPADGIPLKFSTQAELDMAVPQKKADVQEMIQSNKYSGERLIALREQLWRLENAIVSPK